MTAYSAVAAAYMNAKLGALTAKSRMMDLMGQQTKLTEQVAYIGKLAENGRVEIRTDAKRQVKEAEQKGQPISMNDAEFTDYQVIGDEEFDFLSVNGDYDDAMGQVDDWKQDLMADVAVEENKIKQQLEQANIEYSQFNSQAEAWQAQLQADEQEFHGSYGYTD